MIRQCDWKEVSGAFVAVPLVSVMFHEGSLRHILGAQEHSKPADFASAMLYPEPSTS
jgi:hypothetical protein